MEVTGGLDEGGEKRREEKNVIGFLANVYNYAKERDWILSVLYCLQFDLFEMGFCVKTVLSRGCCLGLLACCVAVYESRDVAGVELPGKREDFTIKDACFLIVCYLLLSTFHQLCLTGFMSRRCGN